MELAEASVLTHRKTIQPMLRSNRLLRSAWNPMALAGCKYQKRT
jgi:hypothetical protein